MHRHQKTLVAPITTGAADFLNHACLTVSNLLSDLFYPYHLIWHADRTVIADYQSIEFERSRG